MTPWRERLVAAALWILAPAFVALAIAGGVRNYSIVPFWDAWHGYLGFYTRITEGHWADWWALHNEHRIVLSRLLFYIDLAWFDGTAWFLFACNYLLAFAAFLTFRAMLRDAAGPAAPPRTVRLVACFVLICLFTWMQRENFAWAFQSQFFLAQWLPLLALFLLYRSTRGATGRRDFVLACIVGVLCIGTMANGVLALPLMVAYALLMRSGWKRAGVLACLAAACLVAYFADYRAVNGHGSLRDAVLHHPVQLLRYVLLYIGSPFVHISGTRSLAIGQAAGLAFVALALFRAWQALRAPRRHALAICLLTYILYIVGTAAGTGGGRLPFGLAQAITSRYTTPAIMGWMALLLLYVPALLKMASGWQHRLVWPLLLLLSAMTVAQQRAPRSEAGPLFERDVAGLSLELGLHDEPQMRRVFFSTEWALMLSARPAAANLSVFGKRTVRDVGPQIGNKVALQAQPACRAALTEAEDIPVARNHLRVSGWLAPQAAGPDDGAARLVDGQGVLVGYVLVGPPPEPTPPEAAGGPPARRFKGYLLRSAAHGSLTLADIDGACSTSITMPPRPPFRIEAPAAALQAEVDVAPGSVLRRQGFDGSDFAHSSPPGLQVFGSWVRSDADTGSIVLSLSRGARIAWRSGPVVDHQRFAIGDGPAFQGPLPAAIEWTVLVFDHPLLPERFDLTITDAGKGWGEWSAVGLKASPATIAR